MDMKREEMQRSIEAVVIKPAGKGGAQRGLRDPKGQLSRLRAESANRRLSPVMVASLPRAEGRRPTRPVDHLLRQ